MQLAFLTAGALALLAILPTSTGRLHVLPFVRLNHPVRNFGFGGCKGIPSDLSKIIGRVNLWRHCTVCCQSSIIRKVSFTSLGGELRGACVSSSSSSTSGILVAFGPP